MAAIHELLAQVQDESLQARLEDEINKLSKQKKFGLVFEEHLPECTPLYDIPVKVGSSVAKKDGNISDMYIVADINDDKAICIKKADGTTEEIPVESIVCVAELGEPIYPYLQTIDTICNAPDSDLWHTLIEADNYHALQLLEYMYSGKVDCIYIDPPYNKEDSKDWKYNCNYVDGNDSYRHSKWLSMMERRLKLAKNLLNPDDSVLIVTIDELEYIHLGMLLEQIFPEARIQMVSSVINPKGSSRKNFFSRSNEFLFFIEFGEARVQALPLSDEWRPNADDKRQVHMRWADLMRFGDNGTRRRAPNCFYPILVSEDGKQFIGAGDPLNIDEDRKSYVAPEGTIPIWPIHSDGTEGCWGYSKENLLLIQEKGYVKLGSLKNGKMRITYLSKGTQKLVEEGKYNIDGYSDDGSIISNSEYRNITASTQWNISSHNSHTNGTLLLQKILGKRFTYPKSLYAVHDTLRFFVDSKPNALILDFFAGSGTTLHAVNLLNAEDNGNRRCILVTNNEIGENAENKMKAEGYHPGDPEWESIGIARFATWPRTACSIYGKDVFGNDLEGSYLTSLKEETIKNRKVVNIDFISDSLTTSQKKSIVKTITHGKLPQNLVEDGCDFIVSSKENHSISILFNIDAAEEWLKKLEENEHVTEMYIITSQKRRFNELKRIIEQNMGEYSIEEPVTIPMKTGFKANAIFFKLGFLDKTSIALGRQFREMIPTLWMKAGAVGPCPLLENASIPQMMICKENRFAVLVDETVYSTFADAVNGLPEIETVYVVTDSNAGYREMIAGLKAENTYQLYRDYLDNFRINVGRK